MASLSERYRKDSQNLLAAKPVEWEKWKGRVERRRCSLLAGEAGVYFRKGFGGGSREVEA